MKPTYLKSDSREVEFIALIATMTSLVALSIDAMLPALPDIALDLGVAHENDRQDVISYLFLGLAVGTLIYGPVSDSIGRKRPIYAGIALFLLGTVICLTASDFNSLLAGRILQGLGVAGPRIVSIALVRDLYSGRAMAKVMSLVMAVFILVPALAPLVGQGVMLLGGWRAVFVLFLLLAIVVLIWFALRQDETLQPENRRPLSVRNIVSAMVHVVKNPVALGYTLSAGLVFGAFVGYLASAQQILQELYGLGNQFPLYFAMIALVIGCSSLVNSSLVMRLGMRQLSWAALGGVCMFSTLFLFVSLNAQGVPALWEFLLYLSLTFFCVGILFGNFNALALEPEELGPIAGVASAVVGSLSTLISVPLGGVIAGLFDQSVNPLVAGFAILGGASAGVMYFTERKRPKLRRDGESS